LTDWMVTALWILVALMCFFVVIMIIDGNRFRVVSYEIVSDKLKKDYCFVLLADLHNKRYGAGNRKLIAAIENCAPDAVFIAGDLLTSKPEVPYDAAAELAQELGRRYRVFYGMGNHEARLFRYPHVYGDMGAAYEQVLNRAGIKLMKNTTEDLDESIQVTGLDIDRSYYKRFTPKPMEENYLGNTLGMTNPDKFRILIAHNPDYFPDYARWGADLVLSGHIHGGVIRLPLLGGVASPAIRFFPRYDGGRYVEGRSTMLLSRGLGMHTIPVRIFNPGELVVFHLRPGKGGSTSKTGEKQDGNTR